MFADSPATARQTSLPAEREGDEQANLVRCVGGALTRLYDLPHLQTHPLVELLGLVSQSGGEGRARLLQRTLLEAVQALGPSKREAAERTHRILTLRYLEGLEIRAIQRELGIGRSQYYRDLQKALGAVASLLWDRYARHRQFTGLPNAPVRQTSEPIGLVPLAGGGLAPASPLPIPLTSFVGRDRELAEVRRLLGESRLLTLTGPPGTGKTRLALEAAARMRDGFPDGVYFVPLGPLDDPDLVVPAIAQALGIREYPGRSLEESLVNGLGARAMLLVLDNLEQIVDAGPTIAHLLQMCPLRALATSRVRLRVSGEQEFTVRPLALRSDDASESIPASVTLFIDRASHVNPDFQPSPEEVQLIADVCAGLDGLPLAIELAAARINVLSPGALAARLGSRLALLTGGPRDAPARHQTLRAAIAWSYDLLGATEQVRFEQLSVFAGGWTLEAAEAVVDAETSCLGGGETSQTPSGFLSPAVSVLDSLAALVDASLVQRDPPVDGQPRFMMLETIREFARERLAARGQEVALLGRHADYFLGFAEHAATFRSTPHVGLWQRRVAHEFDNLRSAIDWLETRDAERELRLATALGHFWYLRGLYGEGCERLEAALAASGSALRTRARARALDALAELRTLHGDLDTAVPLVHEAIAIYRELCDLQALGRGYWLLARIAARRPETNPVAVALFEHSIAIGRAVGDQAGVALGLNQLGRALWAAGVPARARERWQESLATFRSIQFGGIGLASCLCNLARVAADQGELFEAQRLLAESFAISRELDYAPTICHALEVSAALAAAEGTADSAERALRLAGASQALQEIMGAVSDWLWPVELQQSLAPARAMLGALAAAAAWAAGQDLSAQQAIAEALGYGS